MPMNRRRQIRFTSQGTTSLKGRRRYRYIRRNDDRRVRSRSAYGSTSQMIIKEEFADIATPTGPMRLHLFRPTAAGRYPGILLYSEIYQIPGPIRRMAAFLAGQGYVVGAPEVYHDYEPIGTVLAYGVAGTDRGNDLIFTQETSGFDSGARARVDV